MEDSGLPPICTGVIGNGTANRRLLHEKRRAALQGATFSAGDEQIRNNSESALHRRQRFMASRQASFDGCGELVDAHNSSSPVKRFVSTLNC